MITSAQYDRYDNPPEPAFGSDSFRCHVCGEKSDPERDGLYQVNRKDVCRSCVDSCNWCGELLDDEHECDGETV